MNVIKICFFQVWQINFILVNCCQTVSASNSCSNTASQIGICLRVCVHYTVDRNLNTCTTASCVWAVSAPQRKSKTDITLLVSDHPFPTMQEPRSQNNEVMTIRMQEAKCLSHLLIKWYLTVHYECYVLEFFLYKLLLLSNCNASKKNRAHKVDPYVHIRYINQIKVYMLHHFCSSLPYSTRVYCQMWLSFKGLKLDFFNDICSLF